MSLYLKTNGEHDGQWLEANAEALPKAPAKHLTDDGYAVYVSNGLGMICVTQGELDALRARKPWEVKAEGSGRVWQTRSENEAALKAIKWYRVPSALIGEN